MYIVTHNSLSLKKKEQQAVLGSRWDRILNFQVVLVSVSIAVTKHHDQKASWELGSDGACLESHGLGPPPLITN